MTPRGIRNNNPGNLRHGSPWQGLAPRQTDRDFCVFVSPLYGIRALARTLLTYERGHGLSTISALIGRFAPDTENDTAAYVQAVARACGLTPDETISVRKELLPGLVAAIIRQENGIQPYGAALIEQAIRLAAGEEEANA